MGIINGIAILNSNFDSGNLVLTLFNHSYIDHRKMGR